MINTSDFKTKTIIQERKNEGVEGNWCIALDIGYSSVKGISNNMVYCFPSYARKITSQLLSFGESSKDDILYKDNTTGEIWSVGNAAQQMIRSDETKDSIAELYGRNRYFSEVFKVISRVGMGIGLLSNDYGTPVDKDFRLQTGLPPAYLRSDAPLLKESLAGIHDFSIKIGNKQWISFKIELPEQNIAVMPQPMGTLFSIATDQYGRQIPEAAKFFKSSVLILDAGFGTVDVFNIRNRIIESTETFDSLGMKGVLGATTDDIMKKLNQEISIPAMQKYLETGQIKTMDRKTHTTALVPFADILEENNKKVCLEVLNKLDTMFNNLFDHDYLVVTGGTGAAWYNIIKQYYANSATLKIVPGNQNDDLPAIFANARGYYMYLLSKLRKETNQTAPPQTQRQTVTEFAKQHVGNQMQAEVHHDKETYGEVSKPVYGEPTENNNMKQPNVSSEDQMF